MQKTGIEYLTHTWNPIAMRCTPASVGCQKCWHLRMANRLAGNDCFARERQKAYSGDGPPILLPDELAAPLRLRKPAVVGVQFMGDLFHEAVHAEWIHLVVAVAAMAPRHTFVILTKRPGRMVDTLSDMDMLDVAQSMAFEEYGHHVFDVHARRRDDGRATAWQFADGMPPNIILGASVEDQPTADERVPLLLQTPTAKRIVSYEPALGGVDFTAISKPHQQGVAANVLDRHGYARGLDQIICGPETGPGARPMDLDWARSARDQCAAANVAFFYKGGLLDGVKHEEVA